MFEALRSDAKRERLNPATAPSRSAPLHMTPDRSGPSAIQRTIGFTFESDRKNRGGAVASGWLPDNRPEPARPSSFKQRGRGGARLIRRRCAERGSRSMKRLRTSIEPPQPVATFEESLVLPVAPSRAFTIIGDPQNGPKIDPMIIRYEPDGGAMRQGGRNHIRGRVFGVPIHVISVTREWDPPRRMVLENITPAQPVRMRLTQTFEPHPRGTLLTYRADFVGFGPAARIFRWFIRRNFRRAKHRVLDLIGREAGSE